MDIREEFNQRHKKKRKSGRLFANLVVSLIAVTGGAIMIAILLSLMFVNNTSELVPFVSMLPRGTEIQIFLTLALYIKGNALLFTVLSLTLIFVSILLTYIIGRKLK